MSYCGPRVVYAVRPGSSVSERPLRATCTKRTLVRKAKHCVTDHYHFVRAIVISKNATGDTKTLVESIDF